MLSQISDMAVTEILRLTILEPLKLSIAFEKLVSLNKHQESILRRGKQSSLW